MYAPTLGPSVRNKFWIRNPLKTQEKDFQASALLSSQTAGLTYSVLGSTQWGGQKFSKILYVIYEEPHT